MAKQTSLLKRLPFRATLGRWLHGRRVAADRRKCLETDLGLSGEISRRDWPESLRDPSRFYLRCFQYFHRELPGPLRRHRAFFAEAGRGFGEEAFHVLWHLLVREIQPGKFLEIGVYRGQVISLVSLLQQEHGMEGRVTGISPFLPAGDSVSEYREDIDYLQDTLENFQHFNLPTPELHKAFSTDPEAQAVVSSKAWDLIYIDGNHDYEVVRADWDLCSKHIRPGGMIVLDDSGLTTAYQPPAFATKGHPGPSRLAQEVDDRLFEEVLQVGHNRVFQKIEA